MDLNLVAQDLFDELKSRYSHLTLGDDQAQTTTDPQLARFFKFDWNNNPVSIAIDEDNLRLVYNRDLADSLEEQDQQNWYQFARAMREFAITHNLGFKPQDIEKLDLKQGDFEFLSQVNTVQENRMHGTTRTTYRPLDKTKMIILNSPNNPSGTVCNNLEELAKIAKKYKIGVRRFNINWVGAYTLYIKETLRFLSVFGQTIVGPIVTSLLFLLVISLAIGETRPNVLGVEYILFLAPGLIAMQVIQQAFSHSSSSLLMGKVMGNIVDMIGAPLSASEVTFALIFASITRSLMISIISIITFSIFIDIAIKNYFIFFTYLFVSSFIMGAAGFIAGLWADKFDHMATVTNFVIVPLSFLSGTFYSLEKLPNFLVTLSYYNPFFHMIDGFRYSFINNMDGSIKFGLNYLFLVSIVLWIIAYTLYKKGYKIKS